MSASRRVPHPGGLSTRSTPPAEATRSARPVSVRTAGWIPRASSRSSVGSEMVYAEVVADRRAKVVQGEPATAALAEES
jgi:hypothetical protein